MARDPAAVSARVSSRLAGRPDVAQNLSAMRYDGALSFILGHEAGHVLLGHNPGATHLAVEAAAGFVGKLHGIATPSGACNAELQCDAIGVRICLGRERRPGINWEHPGREVSRTAEGLALACLAIHACSRAGMPFEPVGVVQHPHATERYSFARAVLDDLTPSTGRTAESVAQVDGLFGLALAILDLVAVA